jgi:hypothetical protein
MFPGFFAGLCFVASIYTFVEGSRWFGLFLLIFAGLLLLVPCIRRARSEFAVTNKRIVVTGSGGARAEFKVVAAPFELRCAVQAATVSTT